MNTSQKNHKTSIYAKQQYSNTIKYLDINLDITLRWRGRIQEMRRSRTEIYKHLLTYELGIQLLLEN